MQSASGGLVGGARMQYHLRMALTTLEAFLFGKPEVFVNYAAKKIDEKSRRADRRADQGRHQAAARGLRQVHHAGEGVSEQRVTVIAGLSR